MVCSRFIGPTAVLLLPLVAAVPRVQTVQPPTPSKSPASNPVSVDLPYIEARPVIEALREDLLPAELRAAPSAGLAALWPEWVSRHDREIRARLDRGDEDSIINLLLFGVTFTTRRRVTERDVPPPGRSDELLDGPLVQGRLSDLIA